MAARLSNSIKLLKDACRRVARGDFEEKVVIKTKDEIGVLAHTVNAMMDGLAERDRVRDTFGRYMTQQVSDAILKGDVKLGGEERELTILRWVMPEYEALSLTMATPPLVGLINRYLVTVVESVMAREGIIDKFMGAGGIAVYGAPVNDPEHAKKAVQSALECHKRLAAFNRAEKKLTGKTLTVAIGINSGTAVTGNIGSEARMEYTALGRPVVVAERLTALAQRTNAGILVSAETAKAAGDSFVFKPLAEPLDLGVGGTTTAYTAATA